MKYILCELPAKCKTFLISDKHSLKNFKNEFSEGMLLEVDFDFLSLGQKLYGKGKKESIVIQKQNCKKVLRCLKLCKKAVRLARKISSNFDGKLYVKNLRSKRNNNDFMLSSMLEIAEAKCSQKFKLAYESACEFIDRENELYNMCDFQGNVCIKNRVNGKNDKFTGCCPSFCKLRVVCEKCPDKNLSCKIFMCEYLISEKGYYFNPQTIPVLKKYFSVFERAASFGVLCRSERDSLKYLKFIRGLTIFCFCAIIFVVVMLII